MSARLILADPCNSVCFGQNVSTPTTVNPTKIGINTESPVYTLEVVGNLRVALGSGGYQLFVGNYVIAGDSWIGVDADIAHQSGLVFLSNGALSSEIYPFQGSNDLYFWRVSGYGDALVITTGGNVGIHTRDTS